MNTLNYFDDPMINICIVDDHDVVRKGLSQIISDESDMKVVCEAADAKEFFDKMPAISPDLVIMDISMPGMNGYDALKKLKGQHPEIPVLMISCLSEDVYAPRSLKAGAAGFVSKEAAPEELVEAVRKVAGGGSYMSPYFTERVIKSLTQESEKQDSKALALNLTEKEFEILVLFGQGKTTSEIAAKLFLSVHTVSSYRNTILKKLRLKSNADLVRFCLKNKIVE